MTALILFEVTRLMLGSKHKSLEQFCLLSETKTALHHRVEINEPSLDARRPVMQLVCEVLVARSFLAER